MLMNGLEHVMHGVSKSQLLVLKLPFAVTEHVMVAPFNHFHGTANQLANLSRRKVLRMQSLIS